MTEPGANGLHVSLDKSGKWKSWSQPDSRKKKNQLQSQNLSNKISNKPELRDPLSYGWEHINHQLLLNPSKTKLAALACVSSSEQGDWPVGGSARA